MKIADVTNQNKEIENSLTKNTLAPQYTVLFLMDNNTQCMHLNRE